MSIWSYKTLSVLPILAITLTGCLSTKPYQPPKNAATATLAYEIDSVSFYSPDRYINQGFKERIDVQLVPSVARTVLLGGGAGKNIYMNLAGYGVHNDINTFEANKKLRFSYQHKVVKGLGDWPLLCVVAVDATLEPNKNYVLKANTTTENFRSKTNFLNEKVEAEDTSCKIQIIDKETNRVIAEENTKVFEKTIPFYNRF